MSTFPTGPVPAESNPPITPYYFQPSLFQIAAITRGTTTILTLLDNDLGGETVEPNFVVGQLVRIIIPTPYGMYQISNQTAYVISLPTDHQIEVNIDSTQYNSFIVSPSNTSNVPTVGPIGDINTGQINTARTGNTTYVPGSFINISPL